MDVGALVKVKESVAKAYGKHLSKMTMKVLRNENGKLYVEVVCNEALTKSDGYSGRDAKIVQHIDDANIHRFPEVVAQIESATGKTLRIIENIVATKKHIRYDHYAKKFRKYPKYDSVLDYVKQEVGKQINWPTATCTYKIGDASLRYKRDELIGAHYTFAQESLTLI